MIELDEANAAAYLADAAGCDDIVEVQALSGGVSNAVLLVTFRERSPWVLKQSRARLRTRADWFSRLERIWIEVEALKRLVPALESGSVPEVVFEDRAQFAFAMTAAPADARVWKADLLAGDIETAVADRAGAVLARMHEVDPGPGLADTQVFDELRVDPYYRTLIRAHPDLADILTRLIGSMVEQTPPRFVHADFSPKNMLIHGRGDQLGLTVVDFETAHAGDPAFDLGFFFSHLLLKAFRGAEVGLGAVPYLELIDTVRTAYQAARTTPDEGLEGRSMRHLAACLLARVDGKSPVDYLTPPVQEAVRTFARGLLLDDVAGWTWSEVRDRALSTG